MKKQTAQSEFSKSWNQMNEDMNRIQDMMDNHMDVDPDNIGWDDVATMTHLANQMREISDQIFNEGEYK